MSRDAFDKAFKPEEPITEVAERILEKFEFDCFKEVLGGKETYVVRLWFDGEEQGNAGGATWEEAMRKVDKIASKPWQQVLRELSEREGYP